MTKFVERAGIAVMALMLGYGLFNVSTLSIKSIRHTNTAAPTGSAETSAGTAQAPDKTAATSSGNAATKGLASQQSASAGAAVAANMTLPDPQAGQKVFAKCKACHATEAGKNGVGPSLHGVVNRPVAAATDYKYSDAMASHSAESWTPEALDHYLTDVKAAVPGTKMAFTGLPKAKDRMDVIAYLAQQSDTPIAPEALGLGGVATTAAAAEPSTPPETAADNPQADGTTAAPITYVDPPPPSAEEQAKETAAAEALKAAAAKLDYQRARYHALHNKPFVDTASNAECLVCHQEVLDTKVRETSPAGVTAQQSLAWYQTLATYDGAQMTFHQRHMSSSYAQAVMNLKCTFCHQGNDVRDESPTNTVSAADMTSNNGKEPFTNRKMVNPSETCLRCHGAMPDPVNIMGLPGPWPEARKDLETADTPNGCLTCHGELFRTNRHKVTYLNAGTIEDLAKESSDVCYGCHGGRSWYRISYPYPRHPWPGMDPAVPDWAKDRKPTSDPRYTIETPAQ